MLFRCNFGLQHKLGMNRLKRKGAERCRTGTLCCGYAESFNFQKGVYLRIGAAEQESSQIPLCRENNFVVGLCLRLTDLITLFFFTGFRLKPQLCLGFRVSESFSTGCSWISNTVPLRHQEQLQECLVRG